MWWIIIGIGASFLVACLARKWGTHGLINGFMSKEQADDLFPEWKKNDKQVRK